MNIFFNFVAGVLFSHIDDCYFTGSDGWLIRFNGRLMLCELVTVWLFGREFKVYCPMAYGDHLFDAARHGQYAGFGIIPEYPDDMYELPRLVYLAGFDDFVLSEYDHHKNVMAYLDSIDWFNPMKDFVPHTY